MDQTNLYAMSKSVPLLVTRDEMHVFLAVCMRSGYVRLPSCRMYWNTDSGVAMDSPGKFISRDRFLAILKYIHFNDNNAIYQ